MEKYMNDIPFELAYRAHAATSFDPEKRAKQEQEGHARYLAELVDKYGHLAGAPEEIENFRTGYLKKKFAHLQARTRIMSPMIVGPANFPTARNQKACDVEHKRLKELIEWRDKAIVRLERNLGLREPSAISSDDPEAIKKLEDKLSDLIEAQEAMKLANKQARKEGKEHPHPAWQLVNNNANIRRIRGRIENLKVRQQDETTTIPFEGGHICDNVAANRLQIIFDSKPCQETRESLKTSGFHWAPSQGAWQRYRSANAMWAAQRIVAGK